MIALALAGWLSAAAFASVEGRFEEANAALAAGDLPAAEAGYRAVLEERPDAGDIWYNLGNVLYRQERHAEAALAWRNAAARLPRDPDIDANLDFVRRTFRDGLVVPDPVPWFAPWQVALTADEGIWLGAALAGLGLLAVAARRRGPHLPLAPVGVGLVVVGGLLAAGGFGEARMPPVAVVLVSEATATSDLGGGVELFTLHAGAEVSTVEKEAGRTLVSLPDGRKGWLPSEALGVVDPSGPPPVL
ncbi:MAG: tetratricopeptide repeat protein [Pseudomonadota bacterium]|nr:tetratricopeptide repeat protein [Pseudomonadota bacterium]